MQPSAWSTPVACLVLNSFFLNHASNAQSFQCFTRFCKFLRTISECHATLHDCRHLLWGALKFLSDISQNMEGVYLPEIKACFASVLKLSNWQFLCIQSRILRSFFHLSKKLASIWFEQPVPGMRFPGITSREQMSRLPMQYGHEVLIVATAWLQDKETT